MKTVKAKSAAIVKAKPQGISIFTRAVDTLDDALNLLGEAVSEAMTPKVAIPLFERIKHAEDAVKELATGVRNSLLEVLEKDGDVITDKGTLVYELDGWKLEARPQKTGLEDKKVEALLRTKGLDPEQGMDATLIYKHSEGKLSELIKLKKITKAELETCRHDLKYALQRPVRTAPQDS